MAAAVVGVAVLALVGACGTGGGGGRPGSANSPDGAVVSGAPTPSAASADLAAVLQRAIIEERHARATYQNGIDALGPVAPFRSIVTSEETTPPRSKRWPGHTASRFRLTPSRVRGCR